MDFDEYASTLHALSLFHRTGAATLSLSKREALLDPIITSKFAFDVPAQRVALPNLIMGIGVLFSQRESEAARKAMELATRAFLRGGKEAKKPDYVEISSLTTGWAHMGYGNKEALEAVTKLLQDIEIKEEDYQAVGLVTYACRTKVADVDRTCAR